MLLYFKRSLALLCDNGVAMLDGVVAAYNINQSINHMHNCFKSQFLGLPRSAGVSE